MATTKKRLTRRSSATARAAEVKRRIMKEVRAKRLKLIPGNYLKPYLSNANKCFACAVGATAYTLAGYRPGSREYVRDSAASTPLMTVEDVNQIENGFEGYDRGFSWKNPKSPFFQLGQHLREGAR